MFFLYLTANIFTVLFVNGAVSSLFALNKDVPLFASDHTNSSYILLK